MMILRDLLEVVSQVQEVITLPCMLGECVMLCSNVYQLCCGHCNPLCAVLSISTVQLMPIC